MRYEKDTIAEEEEEEIANELSEEEMINRFRANRKNGTNKKKYNAELKESIKNALTCEYLKVGDEELKVTDMLAVNYARGLLNKGDKINGDDLISAQKLTGEFTEKKEVEAVGFESFFKELSGNKF